MRLQLKPLAAALALAGLAWLGAPRVATAQQAAPPAPAPAPAPAPTAPPSSNVGGHVGFEYGQYVDTDHVIIETPSISGTVSNPTSGWSAGGSYLVDVVSAASVDIVSTASRHWNEVRQEGNVQGGYKPGAIGGQVSGTVSSEPDYLSVSGGGALTLDLFDKNAALLVGYGHAHDVAGRTGTPFSVFSRVTDRDAFKASMALVLGPRTLATFMGDLVLENGDQSKPYRYVPLFAPGVSVPLGATVDQVNQLRVSARPLEQLPLSRQRYAITARLAHRFHLATLRVEERLYADSWAMLGTTTDARFLFDLGERVETGPHARLHAQSSSSFWRRAYTYGPGFDVPSIRTGDRELGPLVNVTGGWTLRVGLGRAADPMAWILGFHASVTTTQYLDDLYLTQRISMLGGVTLETDL